MCNVFFNSEPMINWPTLNYLSRRKGNNFLFGHTLFSLKFWLVLVYFLTGKNLINDIKKKITFVCFRKEFGI